MTDRNESAGNSAGEGFAGEVRQRAMEAYDSALDSASSATRKAGDTIGESPLMAIGAGIAAGAILAAVLPTSRRERDLLKPYGDRVTGAARNAADAARQAGSDKLRNLGLTPDVITDKASEAAQATAKAAMSTFRNEATKS